MATAPQPHVITQADHDADKANINASIGEAAKKRRKRSPSVAKPAFFIIQIVDEQGQPMPFDKKRVRIVSVERNAEVVMELVESGKHQHAFYLRGIVPVARQSAPRTAGPQAA